MRRVLRTATAQPAISDLTPLELAEFERIERFLADFPYPIRGSQLVSERIMYGRLLYVYFDLKSFPSEIHYQVVKKTRC